MAFYHLSHCQLESLTIIDQVLTNDIKHSLETGVMQTQDISDHYALYCQISNGLPTKKLKNYLVINVTNQNLIATVDTFNEDLHQTLANHFSQVPDLTLNNFNDIFNEFYKLISKTITQHAPLKRYSKRQHKLPKKNNPKLPKAYQHQSRR